MQGSSKESGESSKIASQEGLMQYLNWKHVIIYLYTSASLFVVQNIGLGSAYHSNDIMFFSEVASLQILTWFMMRMFLGCPVLFICFHLHVLYIKMVY